VSDLSILFSPIRIGRMELRNRLVMSPMENSFGTPDGRPSPRSIDYFVAPARGGVELITVGASAIDEKHREVPNSLHFASDDVVSDHRALVDTVHERGSKIQRTERHSVVLLLESGGEHLVRADNVILAGSVEADTNLVESLRDRVPEIYAVGDCTGLGLIKKATLEGAQAAAAL
jgi:hypothetical protein